MPRLLRSRAALQGPLVALALVAGVSGAFARADGWNDVPMNPAVNGAAPAGQLLVRADGTAVGTAQSGGPANAGTIFEVDRHGAIEVMHAFDATDGYGPSAGLTPGNDGNYYGTTSLGGAGGLGVVFRIAPDGSGFQVLHSFDDVADRGTSGVRSALLLGPDGNFYGVAPFSTGYPEHNGTIFRVTPKGDVTILHEFDSRIHEADAGLTPGPDGRLYGASASDGRRGCGILYSLLPDGSGFRFEHRFNHHRDGCQVHATMVVGGDGALYGTTQVGGAGPKGGYGALFRFDPASKAVTVLHRFLVDDPAGYDASAGLSVGPDGRMYGATAGGTANFRGGVFESSPAGHIEPLWSYASDGSQGDTPQSPPVALDANQVIGGLTVDGTHGGGAIYRVKIPK